ncbi:MAG: nucleotidyltransferase domain-containing protein [FCB group bacterium]|jgi:predicted nucleotidyltransferase
MTKEDVFGKIRNFLVPKGAREISVFGSYTRENNKSNHIDLLVDFFDGKSLFDLVLIEEELSAFIGIKVDLLSKRGFTPYLIDEIMNSRKIIYQ